MLPLEVDASFRELVAQNLASRQNVTGQREDFLQALFNVGEKLSKSTNLFVPPN